MWRGNQNKHGKCAAWPTPTAPIKQLHQWVECKLCYGGIDGEPAASSRSTNPERHLHSMEWVNFTLIVSKPVRTVITVFRRETTDLLHAHFVFFLANSAPWTQRKCFRLFSMLLMFIEYTQWSGEWWITFIISHRRQRFVFCCGAIWATR